MAVTLTLDLIEEASRFLGGRVLHTPLEPSPKLSQLLGVPIWLKLECLQTTGSFKLRGALFRLSRLSEEEKRAGVFTCSAGNNGKVWISAFDEDAIMAGNGGSVAAEILEDLPQAQSFVLPVGGGGLAAGVSFLVKAKRPDAIVVGCNHELSPALALSLKQGYAATRLPAATTIAGGIEGGIGQRTFEVLRSRVDQVALLSEAELFEAVRWTFDAHQYVIETASAAPIAACLHGKTGELRGPTVIVLSGRNVSIDTLRLILVSHGSIVAK